MGKVLVAKPWRNATLAAISANTALDLGVYPSYTPAGGVDENTITDYSGFAYCPQYHCMLMFGGGHDATMVDYVTRLSLVAGSALTWVADSARTPLAELVVENLSLQGIWQTSGNPYSRHTYDRVKWFPSISRLGLLTIGTSWGDEVAFEPSTAATDDRIPLYDPATTNWASSCALPSWGTGIAIALDPVSGLAICLGQNGLWTFNPNTESFSAAKSWSDSNLGYSNNMIYCPDDDTFYFIARGTPTRVFALTYNRATPANSSYAEVTGMTGTPNSAESGWAWDSENHIIGGGIASGHFYAFDPATKVWDDKTMTASGTWNGGAIGTLAFHCLGFDPINGVFIFITDSASGRHVGAYRYN